MKTKFAFMAALVLLGGAHLAEAFPYARAAMAARTVRSNIYRGYGYGYGTGVGYNYVYDDNYFANPITPTPVVKATTNSGTLTKLPADAAPVVIFGKTYYFSGGTYYLPQTAGGKTVYVVANP